MNAKLTRSGKDVAQGYDNMYYVELIETGKYEVLEQWNRPHNCTNILCEFILVEKDGEKILLGASANMKHWIGRKIDTIEGMTMDNMAEYLEA